jgi:deferrochelatase/peroxidase EfeB
MSDERKPGLSRRSLFAVSAAVGSTIGLSGPAAALTGNASAASPRATRDVVPFHGTHQAGILTDQQSNTYMAAFDVFSSKRDDVITLLKTWTAAAERLTAGLPVEPAAGGYDATPLIDSGETVGMSPARLTLTFGFGPDFFRKDGVDRFGIAAKQPDALVRLPKFVGDKLIDAKTGGDLSVQACADDPQVAFHAIRQLARLTSGIAELRWVQSGFLSSPDAKGTTPRNLMGFKDGTQTVTDPTRFVWAGNEAPDWMQGGSYLVVRRIRIALEHWDQMKLAFQEQTIGRQKASGAPIGMKHEFDALPLSKNDADGNPIIAENAHVRLANESTNNGAQMLRRGYSYNDGVDFTTERWPPWRQGMEYDAGLLFVCYQRDPRTTFIPMFDKMAKFDMLNQFVTHTGGGIFAVPRGVRPGTYLGQELFASA